MDFKEAVEQWESHDDWRYADREAERIHFFQCGVQKESEESSVDFISVLKVILGLIRSRQGVFYIGSIIDATAFVKYHIKKLEG